MKNRINKTTKKSPNTVLTSDISCYKDEFGQETYLRIRDNKILFDVVMLYVSQLSYDQRKGLLKLANINLYDEYEGTISKDAINQDKLILETLEWGIRQQLLVLLTDEEISEYKMRNQGVVASK